MYERNNQQKGNKNMNENLKIWNYKGSKFRSVEIDGEPYFVGEDAAVLLGYAKPRNAIMSHVDDEDKKDAPIQGGLGGTQQMTIINESGLYSLILSSKIPTAKQFMYWVTSKVLPEFRKNRISEQRFAEIIKGIYNIVFYPAVPGAKKRMFPDLKISEYAEHFSLIYKISCFIK